MRNIILVILAVVLLGVFWYSKNKGEPEIYLIPEDYIGEVVVFFNQSDGQDELYENKTRVYEISNEGILKTKFLFNKGLIPSQDIQYFYVSSDSKIREKLNYDHNIPYNETIPQDKENILVFSKRFGTGIENDDNLNTTFVSLLVGHAIDADSLFYIRENGHTPDKIKK